MNLPKTFNSLFDLVPNGVSCDKSWGDEPEQSILRLKLEKSYTDVKKRNQRISYGFSL